MEKQLKKANVTFERFSAITADDVKNGKYDDEWKANGIAKMDGKKDDCSDCWGTLAGTLSHRHVYRKILEEDPNGTGTYLVLEDDAHLMDGWVDTLNEMVKHAPDDWNVITGGWWDHMRCNDVVNDHFALAIEPHISWGNSDMQGKDLKKYFGQLMYWYAGAVGIVLSPARLPPLLKRFSEMKITYADLAILSDDRVRTYAPVKRFVLPYPNSFLPSDRQTEDGVDRDANEGGKAKATATEEKFSIVAATRRPAQGDADALRLPLAGLHGVPLIAISGAGLVFLTAGLIAFRRRTTQGDESDTLDKLLEAVE
jgi:GR25 family glycosyltransferase involved in LPS biosynthesis